MNKHCSKEVLVENRQKRQMQSWIIFERKIGKNKNVIVFDAHDGIS